MSIELQTPVEMLKRWQGIECTCDPDVGHICEVCHDIQVVKGLMAENERLRSLLHKTTHTPFGQCSFDHLYDGDPCGECEACEYTKQVCQDSREALEGKGDDE